MRRIAIPFTLVFLLGHLTALAGGTESLQSRITEAANKELELSGVPSLQIAVSRGGELLFNQGFGLSDVGNSTPATEETRYRTASVSKWFTATAAMKLSETGKLDLDAPIQSYCPEFPEKAHVITSRQLLSHSAGIRHYQDYDQLLIKADSPEAKQAVDMKRLRDTVSTFTRYSDVKGPLNTFKQDPLLFKPGTAWQYTSFGYRVLGCVIEGAAQKPFSQVLDSLVFNPSGMSHTQADDAWAIIPQRAEGYRLHRDKRLRRADLRDVSENLPAGGHLSSAADLVKFAHAWQTQLLSEASRKAMTSPLFDAEEIEAEKSWRDLIPTGNTYGYGVMLWSKYRPGMLGHTGRQAGAASILVYLPTSGIAVAVLTNAKGWMGYLDFTMTVVEIAEGY